MFFSRRKQVVFSLPTIYFCRWRGLFQPRMNKCFTLPTVGWNIIVCIGRELNMAQKSIALTILRCPTSDWWRSGPPTLFTTIYRKPNVQCSPRNSCRSILLNKLMRWYRRPYVSVNEIYTGRESSFVEVLIEFIMSLQSTIYQSILFNGHHQPIESDIKHEVIYEGTFTLCDAAASSEISVISV